jgi:RNA polymerase sigma-70 factor (ECF subfamily)
LGLATNHDTNPGELPTPDPTNDPVKLADWTEFHQQVEQLPEELRQVFDLFWYGGLNTSEVAEQLRVSVRTVKRRWRDARLLLAEMRAGYAAGQLGNH